MGECSGRKGRWFGHKFIKRTHKEPPNERQIALIREGEDVDAMTGLDRIYNPPRYVADVCERCGEYRPRSPIETPADGDRT